MATKKNHLITFALIGLISGVVCWSGSLFLPEIPALQQYYPAVILGIFLYIAGKYIAHLKTGNDIIALVILILASIAGWRAAIEIGHPLGEPVPFVSAGALGAIITAAGWLIAWRIRSGILKFIIIVTLAGTLGGGIFQLVDTYLNLTGDIWALVLLCVWQSLFFTGIAIAHTH